MEKYRNPRATEGESIFNRSMIKFKWLYWLIYIYSMLNKRERNTKGATTNGKFRDTFIIGAHNKTVQGQTKRHRKHFQTMTTGLAKIMKFQQSFNSL